MISKTANGGIQHIIIYLLRTNANHIELEEGKCIPQCLEVTEHKEFE